jgi:hypothetical protein
MAVIKNAGRQEVIAVKQDLPYADIATAGEYEVINLPAGAIITAGYIYSGWTGPTDYALVVEDAVGASLIADMAGTYGAGRVNITPTGAALAVPGYVKLTTTGNATAGTGYIYLEYVVNGRAAFSEG